MVGKDTLLGNSPESKEIRRQISSFKTIDLSQQSEDHAKFRVPTGIKALDLITGGGFPGALMSEVYGPWASGKTRIACHAVAQTIKAGGFAIFCDNERSLSKGLLDLTGVDASRLIYPDPGEITCIEDVFNVRDFADKIDEFKQEQTKLRSKVKHKELKDYTDIDIPGINERIQE